MAVEPEVKEVEAPAVEAEEPKEVKEEPKKGCVLLLNVVHNGKEYKKGDICLKDDEHYKDLKNLGFIK